MAVSSPLPQSWNHRATCNEEITMKSIPKTVKTAPLTVKLAVGLAMIATTVSGTLAKAQKTASDERNTRQITLVVYDYAHVNQRTLQEAEKETARILAKAGVIARWVDCPTQGEDMAKYPVCAGLAEGTKYKLQLLSSSMAAALTRSRNSLGYSLDCEQGPCIASVNYDRIESISGGNRVSSYVLMARVTAREIGQMLIGATYRSRSGIMNASWTYRQLGQAAGQEMLFSPSEASAMKARLAEREQASATHLAEAGPGQLTHAK
jgi:hypothetical protein